jgi:hypothetical protein
MSLLQEVEATVVFDFELFDVNNTNSDYGGYTVYRTYRIPHLYGHLPAPVADLTIQSPLAANRFCSLRSIRRWPSPKVARILQRRKSGVFSKLGTYEKNGASEGIRTLDTHVGNVMLYQAELRSLPYHLAIFWPFITNCKREFRPFSRRGASLSQSPRPDFPALQIPAQFPRPTLFRAGHEDLAARVLRPL